MTLRGLGFRDYGGAASGLKCGFGDAPPVPAATGPVLACPEISGRTALEPRVARCEDLSECVVGPSGTSGDVYQPIHPDDSTCARRTS